MYRYAQIDLTTGVCISVSYLSGEVDAENMILLSEDDDVNPRDTWDGTAWTPAPPLPEPQPTPEQLRMAQLEQESADLKQAIAELTMLVMPTTP